MPKIEMVKKPGPTDFILKVTSETLEEAEFLGGLYDRRCTPFKVIINLDNSVTVEWTY